MAFFVWPVRGDARQPRQRISASIAVVMDYHTGEILYDRNMTRRWVPASITKMMTAFIVYQEIEAGNLTLCTPIRVSAGAAAFSSDRRQQGSFVPLPAGAYLTVDELLHVFILPSANAGGVVFAEHISGSEAAFVERMNATAAELGMYSSFTNTHGAIPHHTDAYSIAVLIREFISRFPDILRIASTVNFEWNGTVYRNTNTLLRNGTFDGLDGFKTGTLRQAGWNHSVTAERDGRRIIAVLMHANSNDNRHRDAARLLEFGFEELARREAERAARVRVFFGGQIVPMNAAPIVTRGGVKLSLRSVFEWMGYTVEWHAAHRLVQLTHSSGGAHTFFEGRNLAVVNGRGLMLPAPVQAVDGNLYIPIDALAAVTNTEAVWDVNTGVIQFTGGDA